MGQGGGHWFLSQGEDGKEEVGDWGSSSNLPQLLNCGPTGWGQSLASSDSINSITISPNKYKMPGGKRMVDLDDLS